MTKKIVLIEQLDEIKLLENFIDENTIIISLIPSVLAELNKKKISCHNTLELFGKQGHQKVIEKGDQILSELRPSLKNLQARDIKFAFEKTWVFYFHFHLNYLVSMLYIIDQSVKKYKPEKFICVHRESKKKSRFVDQYSVHGLVNEYCLAHKIKVQNVNKRNHSLVLKSSFSLINNLISNLIKRCVFEFQLLYLRHLVKNRSLILALEDTYKMPLFLSDVIRKTNFTNKAIPVYLKIERKSIFIRIKEIIKGTSFSFFFLPTKVSLNNKNMFQNQLDICILKIHNSLANNPQLSEIFGVDISSLLIKYIDNELQEKMHDLNGEIFSLSKILDITQPVKVFAQHSLGLSYALGEVCLQSNLPALLISHGSHVSQNDSISELEWSVHAQTLINSHYPFVAIQTPSTKKFLDSQKNVISKYVNTGPLLFARKKKEEINRSELREEIFGKFSNKCIILHASTPKKWKFFRPWVYETVDEYIQSINNIIQALKNIPDMYLAIRFRPQDGISLEDLKLSLVDSESYGIFIDREFEDFLLASDFLLSYSSTAIEEALQYDLPVIQYDPDGKYEHIQGEKLKFNKYRDISTIYSVLAKNDLSPALEWLNKNHKFSDNNNLSWLNHSMKNSDEMNWLKKMDLKKC